MPDHSVAGRGAGAPTGTPLASIIVPVHNGAATIAECVSSLLAMRFPRGSFEVLVVDNGSTDATRDVLRGFGDAIRVFSEATRGAGPARNRGIREARGAIIAFTDADCVADIDWLHELLEPLDDSSVGVVGGAVLSRPTGNRIERFGEAIHDQRVGIEENDTPYVITGNWASPRHVVVEVGPFDESLARGQDVDLSWRIREAGYRFVYQPSARVVHRNERTLWGLMHEGFVHGFHGVRVRQKHRAVVAPHAYMGTSLRRRLGRDLRLLVRPRDPMHDRTDALLQLLFDVGKTGGELLAIARMSRDAGMNASGT